MLSFIIKFIWFTNQSLKNIIAILHNSAMKRPPNFSSGNIRIGPDLMKLLNWALIVKRDIRYEKINVDEKSKTLLWQGVPEANDKNIR